MDIDQKDPALSRRSLLQTLIAGGACARPNIARGAPAEPAGVHNWMLVGRQTAFLSHLPMFEQLNSTKTGYMTPHRFQVILQASFMNRSSDATASYFADRTSHPEVKMFTVSPAKKFVLPQVAAQAPLTAFAATVLRGHLERGGQPIRGLENITVKIQKIVHFKEFVPSAQAPRALEYLLFGRGKELFVAHSIVKPPDFDQIVSAEVSGAIFDDLSRAVRITIAGRPNSPSGRLKENEQVTAETSDGRKFNLRAGTEFYFEEGELLMPATFDTTPEEKKAGFTG